MRELSPPGGSEREGELARRAKTAPAGVFRGQPPQSGGSWAEMRPPWGVWSLRRRRARPPGRADIGRGLPPPRAPEGRPYEMRITAGRPHPPRCARHLPLKGKAFRGAPAPCPLGGGGWPEDRRRGSRPPFNHSAAAPPPSSEGGFLTCTAHGGRPRQKRKTPPGAYAGRGFICNRRGRHTMRRAPT